MVEQGVAGSNPARFNFLINFFFVSSLKGGGYLIKSYKQLLFSFHRIAWHLFSCLSTTVWNRWPSWLSGVVMWRKDPVR